MDGRKDDGMGRVTVEVELTNNEDTVLAKARKLSLKKVRRVRTQGVVDTGAMRLVLPQSVVEQLGLTPTGETKVRYADHRTATRPVVENVRLKMLGRESVFTAIVESKRRDALIGAIVLEELDFVVDCITQTLHPRDPDRILSEIE